METLNTVLALITGLCGLVAAGVAAYFAIKNFVEKLETKNKNEVWAMIMSIADAGMKEAEKTGKSGADKKAIVINIVKAGCRAADLNIEDFLDKLSAYIDNTIAFVNEMTKEQEG